MITLKGRAHVVATALVTVFAVFGLMVSLGGSAKAESFTYWSLWVEEDGKWAPSQQGASDLTVTDQSVLGAKYLESEVELTSSDAPELKPDYAALCPDLPAAEGQVRVAIVLEYGDASLAPDGTNPPGNSNECVTIPEPATAAVALENAGSVTADSAGFITAINGYPADAAGASVTPSAVPVGEPDDEGTDSWIIVVVGVVILAILIAIFYLRSQRRGAQDANVDSTQ
ncbi:MAG: hypothetical protein K0U64_00895 [Actinomycetia bacterium]|nr:hypothetical protein [Actinomycetes bacterium]